MLTPFVPRHAPRHPVTDPLRCPVPYAYPHCAFRPPLIPVRTSVSQMLTLFPYFRTLCYPCVTPFAPRSYLRSPPVPPFLPHAPCRVPSGRRRGRLPSPAAVQCPVHLTSVNPVPAHPCASVPPLPSANLRAPLPPAPPFAPLPENRLGRW